MNRKTLTRLVVLSQMAISLTVPAMGASDTTESRDELVSSLDHAAQFSDGVDFYPTTYRVSFDSKENVIHVDSDAAYIWSSLAFDLDENTVNYAYAPHFPRISALFAGSSLYKSKLRKTIEKLEDAEGWHGDLDVKDKLVRFMKETLANDFYNEELKYLSGEAKKFSIDGSNANREYAVWSNGSSSVQISVLEDGEEISKIHFSYDFIRVNGSSLVRPQNRPEFPILLKKLLSDIDVRDGEVKGDLRAHESVVRLYKRMLDASEFLEYLKRQK